MTGCGPGSIGAPAASFGSHRTTVPAGADTVLAEWTETRIVRPGTSADQPRGSSMTATACGAPDRVEAEGPEALIAKLWARALVRAGPTVAC